jgi:hypothetical protein
MMVNKVCEHLGSPLPHPSSFSPSTVHTLDSLPPAATFPTPSNTTTSQSIHSAPASTSSTTTSPPLSLYAFPAPTSLTSTSTDALLRSLGFGYRAPFIAWTANYLLATSSSLKLTPDAYLDSLRHGTYQGPNGLAGVREKLLEFKGVGRKVADCVALFSLGWKEVVPVDTHVFQVRSLASSPAHSVLTCHDPLRSPSATTPSPPPSPPRSRQHCTTASARDFNPSGAPTLAGVNKSSSLPISRRPLWPLCHRQRRGLRPRRWLSRASGSRKWKS